MGLLADLQAQQLLQAISKNLSSEVEYSVQRSQEVKRIGSQLQNQHSSLTQSTGLSHQVLTAMGKASSQDQCASSDSVHDERGEKHGQDMKPVLFLQNPDLSMNSSQSEIGQPIVQFPYAYADPYITGLYTVYGPHNVIQPQLMTAASGRIPLPADIPEDGPVYVNAKQYHGILRRRQTRAKLEAQNKLVKNRKPYLHESRHQHALNRVRGSGGRFLSTKKAQQPDSLPPTSSQSNNASNSFLFSDKANTSSCRHQVGVEKYDSAPSTAEGTTRVSTVAAILQPPDGRFSSHVAVPMQGSGGYVFDGNRRYASIVR